MSDHQPPRHRRPLGVTFSETGSAEKVGLSHALYELTGDPTTLDELTEAVAAEWGSATDAEIRASLRGLVRAGALVVHEAGYVRAERDDDEED